MFPEQPGVFTEEQIADFLKNIINPEEKAEKERWFREFGRTAARMNKAFPADDVQHRMELEGSSEENV